MFFWLDEPRKDTFVLAVVLFIAIVGHGFNMHHFPYWENDEGTYMSQAHALMTEGELAHYTYWYDHAPGGWIVIGLWSRLIAIVSEDPYSLYAGRTFMLVLHVLSSLLLFGISKKLIRGNLPAVAAVFIFSVSPLAVMYQRRILLDNIMVFWLLLAIYLVTGPERRLHHFLLSGLVFAIAILSKESAVFFGPGLLLAVYMNSDRTHRSFAVVLWLILCGLIVVSYPLYALLNGEFFPVGHPLGSASPHASLLDTLQYQITRTGGFFLSPTSAFRFNLDSWIFNGDPSDPTLIVAGGIATLIVTAFSVREKKLRPIVLMVFVYFLYLIRGGIVIAFYIVPAIPFLALCIGYTVEYAARFLERHIKARRTLAYYTAVGLCLLPFGLYYAITPDNYVRNQSAPQALALDWIQDNVATDAFILIDNYAFLELFADFDLAHYYWKAELDPEVNEDILEQDWCNVDYLLVTPQLTYDARREQMQLIGGAYDNSTVLVSYPGDGWPVEIRQVNKAQCDTTAKQ